MVILGINNSGSSLENREYGRGDPLSRPRDTLYPQKLTLTSPTSGGHSVGIVRSWTKATEFSLVKINITGNFLDLLCLHCLPSFNDTCSTIYVLEHKITGLPKIILAELRKTIKHFMTDGLQADTTYLLQLHCPENAYVTTEVSVVSMAPHVLIHVHFCRPILATNHT
jgi:hypothetical protein